MSKTLERRLETRTIKAMKLCGQIVAAVWTRNYSKAKELIQKAEVEEAAIKALKARGIKLASPFV